MQRNLVNILKAARPAIAAAQPSALTRAFTVSTACRMPSSLKDALAQEIKYEKSSDFQSSMPDDLAESLKALPFKLVAKDGSSEAVLERTFENEKISISFDIIPEASTISEEDDEDFDSEEVDNEVSEEIEEDEGEDEEYSIPISIEVTRVDGGEGVLKVYGSARDDELAIEGVEFAKNAEELDDAESTAYLGPKFDDLDFDLQDGFGEYLDERGVDEKLSNFILDFAEWKERKEYVQWLENVKKFVDAKK